MPLFKVAMIRNKTRRVTVCAASLDKLLEKAIRTLSPSSAPSSYEAYDDSDGTLISDDDSLTALEELTRSTKGCLLFITLVPCGEDWSQTNGSSSPSTPVSGSGGVVAESQASSSIPAVPAFIENVSLLRTAVSSPLSKRTNALLRAKRAVVKSFVEKLKSVPLSPGDLRKICGKVRSACPDAFVVQIKDDVVGDSFHSFVKSVYNSINYARTCEGTPRKRRAVCSEDPDDPLPEAAVPLLCVDDNGCAEGMWGPTLSKDEEDHLTSIQQSLMTTYSSFQFGLLDDNAVDLVQESYALTRAHINKARTKSDWLKVFASWPVLQQQKPFLAHANLLVGKICEEVWAESLCDPQPFVKFMAEYCTSLDKNPSSSGRLASMRLFLEKSSEAVEQRENVNPLKAAMFPLLVNYFREKLDLLFITVDAQATDNEVKDRVNEISESPLLVVKGLSIFDQNAEFLIVVRGQFIINSPSFVDGLLTVILSYFVFNIQYPKALCRSLEFIQRFLLRVNPKVQCRKEGKQKTKVSPPLQL